MNKNSSTSGYAIAVVMLFTVLTLVIVMISMATVTNASRTSLTRSNQTDRSLMAADSGISSMIAQLREGQFRGEFYDLGCWIQKSAGQTCTNGLSGNTTTIPQAGTFKFTNDTNAPSATVDVTLNATDESIKVTSVGSVDGKKGAMVEQNIRFVLPPMLSVGAPAALTSCPNITAGGNANLYGDGGWDKGIQPLTTITSVSKSATTGSNLISVADTTSLRRGSFISINGIPYRVTSKLSSTQITVEYANPTRDSGKSNTLSGTLGLISMTRRAATTIQPAGTFNGAQMYEIPFNDPTAVIQGDVLYFWLNGSMYGVTVREKGFQGDNLESGYVRVTLGATRPGDVQYDQTTGAVIMVDPSTGLPPAKNSTVTPVPLKVGTPTLANLEAVQVGDPFSRYVPGAMSDGAIEKVGLNTTDTDLVVKKSDWGSNINSYPNAIANSSNLNCGALFQQVFNMTKQQYLDLGPTILTGISANKPLTRDLYWLGSTTTIPSSTVYNLGSDDLCGSGILVVNGDLTMQGTGNLNASTQTCVSNNGSGPKGFTGIIYVLGSFTNTGNSIINGALIVEGRTNISTAVGGGMNINFTNSAVLAGAGRLARPAFILQKGTWRQQ